MSKKSPDREKESGVPLDEIDLLVGCGEVIFGPMPTYPRRGSERLPTLVLVLLAGGPAWKRYAAPAGLTLDLLSKNGEEPDVVAAAAAATLDRMRTGGSPLFGEGAIPASPPLLAELVACIAARHFRREEACSYEDLSHVFCRHAPTPGRRASLLRELERLCGGPRPLVYWDWSRDPSRLSYSFFGLTQAGLELLRFTFAGDVDCPRQGARHGRPGRPEAAPDGGGRAILNVVSEGLPTLADLMLPGPQADEMAFVAALMRKDDSAAPVILLHGPPGTGKTHAARALAGELGRRLATVSFPDLVDKWLGETEKNLAASFAEAAAKKAVLLLDEADALLRDRRLAWRSWEVSMVNVLLKLLEAPITPVLLCTNFFKTLDPATMRRIQHLLEFPVPGFGERRAIWARELSLAGIGGGSDLEALAEVVLSGGLIHNAAERARRMRIVLGDSFVVSTQSLLDLARAELPKMGTEEGRRVAGFQPGDATSSAGADCPDGPSVDTPRADVHVPHARPEAGRRPWK